MSFAAQSSFVTEQADNFGAANDLAGVGPVLLVSDRSQMEGGTLTPCLETRFHIGAWRTRITRAQSRIVIGLPGLPASAGIPALYRQVDDGWAIVPNQSSTRNELTTCLGNYGHYRVFVPILDQPYRFGEVYVFPNPVKGEQKSTLHIEVGQSDKITTRIYDVSGDLVYSAQILETPIPVAGRLAYEHVLDTSRFRAGSYIGVITAEKTGKTPVRKNFRFSVIK
jgi:hypothetical protein